jgi:hypothetical protein
MVSVFSRTSFASAFFGEELRGFDGDFLDILILVFDFRLRPSRSKFRFSAGNLDELEFSNLRG